jgi:predicted  nucleic acid-binding Zn-ribbon protein
VQAELEQLLVLQDREQKIRQIQAETKAIPQQKKALETQLAAVNAAMESLKQRSRHIELDRKNLELDAGKRSESVARLKTQQFETRKNEEFRAIAHEIERYEKEIHDIEDRELDLMEQTEQVKKQIVEEDGRAAAARESIARQGRDLEEKGKALESRLADLTKERENLAAAIDEDLLSVFERLFASKGDAAIVALEHEVCTGCHMKVPTHTAARVKGGKEIVSCDQCGRILYLSE